MGSDIKKDNPVRIDLRSWLVTILGVIILIVIASYVYKTIPGSSAFGDPPATFDWRDHQGENWMTSVKDQGNCGSCDIFAATGTIEAATNIETNNPNLDLDLSEQFVVSCHYGHQYCAGSILAILKADLSLNDSLKNEGVPDENCFPYTATDEDCANRCDDWEERLMRSNGYSTTNYLPFDLSARSYRNIFKHDVFYQKPFVVGLFMDGTFDGNDVYSCHYPRLSYGHAVVLVGYNDVEEYWIMKNCWGDNWPPPSGDGYFKLAYNSGCNIFHVTSFDGVIIPPPPILPIGQTIRITNDDNFDGDPVIRDNQIVWTKTKNEHSYSPANIYYLKVPGTLPPNYTPTPIAITNDDLNQATPTICGSTIYYSEEGRIMYRDVQQSSPNSYQLCTDQMREDGRCRGYGYGVDCSATAVTYVRPTRDPYTGIYNDIVRFNLDDSVYYRERPVNGGIIPSGGLHQPDGDKRPQISADGLRIVFSEWMDGYMGDNSQAYYYDGIPPQPPFDPGDPPGEFPKFVEINYFYDQYNVDFEDNIVVWAQQETRYTLNTDIHIKNLATGDHTVVPRIGLQIMPAISGNWIAYLDRGANVMLYDIVHDIHYEVTDLQDTIDREIQRKDLDFQGNTIVWAEEADDERWDIYMFKLNS